MNPLGSLFFYPCGRIGDFVYAYCEGRLPGLVRARFEAHLTLCKGCREYVHLYRSAADGAAFRALNPPPPDLLDKTLEFLQAEGWLDGPDGADRSEGGRGTPPSNPEVTP